MKVALTIAGSDCSGGAGIQADLKTMTTNGVFAESVITALTAQNTTGVFGVFESSPEFVTQQLDAVFSDIYPDAVKIGMVSSAPIIEAIAEGLKKYEAKNVVIDPVMVSTSGSKLLQEDAISTLEEVLFPLATLLTPNIPEAEILSDIKINSAEDMTNAAEIIGKKYNAAVLLKGGHSINDANDLLYSDEEFKWFSGKRIDNPKVFTDIYPDAVKIGMVSYAPIIKSIAEGLKKYEAKNIVIDPVMVSTSGSKLLQDDAISTLEEVLFPLAMLLTPNIPEAEILSNIKINSADDMTKAAEIIGKKYNAAVLLKGGHSINDANDLLYSDEEFKWFSGKRIDNPNTHGTGCTLSSAIASNLAKGMSINDANDLLYSDEEFKWFSGKRIDNPNTHGTGCTLSSAIASNLAKGMNLDEAVESAKAYISGALAAMLDLGKGSGPMNHAFAINGKY